jgi:hypothetical protein
MNRSFTVVCQRKPTQWRPEVLTQKPGLIDERSNCSERSLDEHPDCLHLLDSSIV